MRQRRRLGLATVPAIAVTLAACRQLPGWVRAIDRAGSPGFVRPMSGEPRAPAPQPRVAWRVPGAGWGTPAQDDSAVFFLSRHHEVVAIERRTGAIRWRAETGEPGAETAGSRVLVLGDTVMAGDYDLAGFDRRTGRRLWTFAPDDGYAVGMYLGVVAGDVALAGSASGRLYALDDRGRCRWSTKIAADPATVFAPIASDGLVAAAYRIYSSPLTEGVVVLDADSGGERWRSASPGPPFVAGGGAAGGPLMAGGFLFAAARDGTIAAFSPTRGTRLATIAGPERAFGGAAANEEYRPLVRAGALLVAGALSGQVSAYDLRDRRLRWRCTPVGASVAFGLAASAEDVVVPYLSGDLVDLDARSGRLKWAVRSGGFRWPPLIGDGRVYAAAASGFWAFDGRGQERTKEDRSE